MTGGEDSYARLSVGAFLDALAAGAPAPAAGSAVALVLAQAAALCAKSARLSARQLTAGRAAHLTAEAERIRCTAASLIDEDPRAFQAVIEQRRRLRSERADDSRAAASEGGADGGAASGETGAASGEGGGAAGRSAELAAALSDAAEVPMRIVELAVPLASLAAALAGEGNPALRGDAIAAGLLARAAARAAAVLVSINLADMPTDPRHVRADSLLAAMAAE